MRLAPKARCFVFFFCTLFFGTISFFYQDTPLEAASETYDFTTVASPIILSGDVNDHDIVSYSSTDDEYHASGSFADESMFGVIVDDPVLYMESEVSLSENARPVVRYGEVLVNVSTLGGEIHPGDIITTSPIPGIGQKVARKDAPYILGFALDDMFFNGESIDYEGEEVLFGTVPVALRIGPYLTKTGVAFVSSGKEYETIINEIRDSVTNGTAATSDPNAIGAFKVFRYLLAAAVAITAMIVAIGRFGDAFKQSVVSVGRNPLARSQIRSILIWNVLLIVLVSGTGLGIAIAIILFP